MLLRLYFILWSKNGVVTTFFVSASEASSKLYFKAKKEEILDSLYHWILFFLFFHTAHTSDVDGKNMYIKIIVLKKFSAKRMLFSSPQELYVNKIVSIVTKVIYWRVLTRKTSEKRALPYMPHYNPRFVYFKPSFWRSKMFFQGGFFRNFYFMYVVSNLVTCLRHQNLQNIRILQIFALILFNNSATNNLMRFRKEY